MPLIKGTVGLALFLKVWDTKDSESALTDGLSVCLRRFFAKTLFHQQGFKHYVYQC